MNNMRGTFVAILLVLSIVVSASGKKTKVIFMGDSITDGNWGCGHGNSADSRNKGDFNHIYGHGFMEMITGYYMSKYPEDEYVFQNRGISGYRLSNLEERWEKDVINECPDVLSILVGTNDVGMFFNNHAEEKDFDYHRWDSVYRSLLDRTKEANPSVRIVLCSPFFVKEAMNGKSPEILSERVIMTSKLDNIVEKIADDYNAIYVPYDKLFVYLYNKYSVPDDYWSWDGVHPTTQAHYKMADLWIKKVKRLN